ncbi:MAG TPA: site-specific DNA-methyltransferase [Cyclobacteriaceae bacterium]|nr:site-specific DNA-methyltransferase [Cyclobacteriaceae bacterium]
MELQFFNEQGEEIYSRLFLGDCLEIMSEIPDGSADMVLCDLPYGTTQNRWDTVINLEEFWIQTWKICKPNAAVVLFSAQPFTTTLIQSQIKNFKYEWVWIKNLKTGNLNARRMPMGGHETIQVFYKKQPTYNPQKRERTTEVKSGNKRNSKTSNYGTQRELYLDRQSDKIMPDTALLNFKCVHNSSGKLHPTQKPIELCEYFINTYTNVGETVLDMAAGSGTAGLAAKNLGRNSILIEKEEKYYDIMFKRVGGFLNSKNNSQMNELQSTEL